VDIHDQPYEEFVNAVKATNGAAIETHQRAGK
jgi:hypothetical protein